MTEVMIAALALAAGFGAGAAFGERTGSLQAVAARREPPPESGGETAASAIDEGFENLMRYTADQGRRAESGSFIH